MRKRNTVRVRIGDDLAHVIQATALCHGLTTSKAVRRIIREYGTRRGIIENGEATTA